MIKTKTGRKVPARLGLALFLLAGLPWSAPKAGADTVVKKEKIVNPAVLAPAVKPVEPKVILDRAKLESPEGMGIYETKVLEPRPEVLRNLMKTQNLDLKPRKLGRLSLYQEKAGNGMTVTRMGLDAAKGHMFMLPNIEALAKSPVKLLPQPEAFKTAQAFVSDQALVPQDASELVPQKMVVLTKADVTKDGKAANPVDVLQTVVFQRNLDKKPILGKGSQLTIDLAGDKVVGLNRAWNGLVKSPIKPEFLSGPEIYDSIVALAKQRITGAKEITIKRPHLIYYGNGGKYVQPAYFFTAVISPTDGGQKGYFAGVVPATKNPPEAVMPAPSLSEKPMEASLQNPALKKLSVAPNDPTVGRYVVRNDSWDWVDDANEFKDGLNSGHPSGYPAITFGDYYWDWPSYWTTSANSFVNKWNITLMEGHGNTWLFTTSKNCCDTVNLNSSSQPGYGNLSGSSMRYLILKGCSIIPAPPDRSDWAAPWWRIFKGLHMAVGFRTEMYIDDDIAQQFGNWLAQNCQVMDSWFCATNNCSSYQWERFWGSWGDEIYGYGSVVLIPGYEHDGIYDTAAAPAATSLSIWWQH